MKHADNQINLDPILFPMSLFLSFATLNNSVWLTLCWSSSRSRDDPKVACLNATERSGLVGNARYESWFCFRLQEHTGLLHG